MRLSLPTISPGAGPQAGARRRTVVLVDFFWTRDGDPRVPLGHASLVAALRARTPADVRPIVLGVNDVGPAIETIAIEEILRHVGDLEPEEADVAIGVYVWSENVVQAVLHRLRSRGFRGRIILGGPQISYAGPGVDRIYPHADAFVRGYGELPLCALAMTPGSPSIPGVHYAETHDTVGQAAVDFEALPSPFLNETIPLSAGTLVRWETQRGCQYRCSFCQHAEAGSQLPHRALQLDRVMQEIELFCSRRIKKISVLDPVFNLNSSAVQILKRFAEHRFAGRLSLQCRAERIGSEFLDAAERLDVCLEFGLQTIHAAEGLAVGRRNGVAKVDGVLADCRRRRIDHEVSLIFGLPNQTRASFEESVRWCIERRVPTIKAFPLLLLRGTALERERAKWGYVEMGSAMPMAVESNSFSQDDWWAMAKLSQALQDTEGNHPGEMRALLALARHSVPTIARWQAPHKEAVGTRGERK